MFFSIASYRSILIRRDLDFASISELVGTTNSHRLLMSEKWCSDAGCSSCPTVPLFVLSIHVSTIDTRCSPLYFLDFTRHYQFFMRLEFTNDSKVLVIDNLFVKCVLPLLNAYE